MGPPYNIQHNSYLKRYLSTQQPHILNSPRKLEGRHKMGHAVPLTIFVTKLENGGDVSFMAVVRSASLARQRFSERAEIAGRAVLQQ